MSNTTDFIIQDGVLTKYNGAGGDVVIPNGVTAIGDNAFRDCESLKSIVIPSSVTSIGNCAFNHCINLKNVTLPESVTTIGNDAFLYCVGLSAIYISNLASWVSISFCNNLSNPLYYAKHLYVNNQLLTKAVLSGNIATIGNYAFSNCICLESVSLPETITDIGISTFRGCSNLAKINIPSAIKSIADFAFCDCRSLTIASLPIGVSSIGSSAFKGCKKLANINIPKGIQRIEDYTFCGCNSLSDILIPDSVISIGVRAFDDCTRLSCIFLPDSVTEIGDCAFWGCSNLANIRIPDSISYLGNSAFSFCKNLTSIIIPSGVTHIGNHAFEFCSQLKRITLPDGIVSIGDDAFFYCDRLASITIPDSVTSIGKNAFANCTGLAAVYINNLAHWVNISFGDWMLCGNAEANPLYYAKQLYVNNQLLTDAILPEGVTKISEYAFINCNSLSSMRLPSTVTHIGNSAFCGCTNLTEINIPDGVKQLDHYTFRDCRSLRSITLPASITFLGEGAFCACENLTSITLSNASVELGRDVFQGCSNLTNISFPNGITGLENATFRSCDKLKLLCAGKTIALPTELIATLLKNDASIKVSAPAHVAPRLRPLAAATFFKEYQGDFSDDGAKAYLKYLSSNSGKLIEFAPAHVELLSILCSHKFISAKHIDAYISAAQATNHVEAVSMLLNYKLFTLGEAALEKGEKVQQQREAAVVARTLARANKTGIEGLVFVAAARFNYFETRADLKTFLIDKGATLATTLSTKVDYLISNDSNGNTDNITRAKSLGICIISERELMQMAGAEFDIYKGTLEEFRGWGGEIVIPDGVTTIGPAAFQGCMSLSSVVLPYSVTTIKHWAFKGCDQLKAILIPDSVTSIGANAFSGCSDLTIQCKQGSFAMEYANSHKISCQII